MGKTFIIIQARLGSSRLKNKILKKINGQTLIEIMLKRLSHSKYKKNIVIAIPNNSDNNKLYDYLIKKNYKVLRGSENNVLSRYYHVAKKINAKHIIRLTSDCPLIDHKIIQKLSNFYFKNRLDYANTDKKFAEGLDCEIFSFKTLEKIYFNSKIQSEKEHVSLYIKNNIRLFKTGKINSRYDNSNIRITVDEKKDFFLLKKLAEKFPDLSSQHLSSEKIVHYLNNSPKLLKINSNIIRNEGLVKSYIKEKINVLFISEMGKTIGTGNTIRLINYSKFINKKIFVNHIAIRSDTFINKKKLDLKDFQHNFIFKTKKFHLFKKRIFRYLNKNNIKILILDLLSNSKNSSVLLKNFLQQIQYEYNIKIILIGDYRTDLKLFDFLIIPQNIPNSKINQKLIKNKKIIFGLQCFPFNRLIYNIRHKMNLKNKKTKNILIFISGSDPKNITENIISEIKRNNYKKYKFKIIFNKDLNRERFKKNLFNTKNNTNIKIEDFEKDKLILLSKWSDINIVGEGLSVIESIFLFKKTIVINFFSKNYSDTKNLNILKKNKCIEIIKYNSRNKIDLEKKIKLYKKLYNFKKMVKFNKGIFSGYQNFNINKILLRTLNQ